MTEKNIKLQKGGKMTQTPTAKPPAPTKKEAVREVESDGHTNLPSADGKTLSEPLEEEAVEDLRAVALERNRELQAQPHNANVQKMIEDVFRSMSEAGETVSHEPPRYFDKEDYLSTPKQEFEAQDSSPGGMREEFEPLPEEIRDRPYRKRS